MNDEQINDIPVGDSQCGKLVQVGDPVTWKKSGRMVTGNGFRLYPDYI